MNVLTKRRKEKSGSLGCLWGVAVLEYSEGTWQQAASLTRLRRWLNAHIKESRWRDVAEPVCWLKGWEGRRVNQSGRGDKAREARVLEGRGSEPAVWLHTVPAGTPLDKLHTSLLYVHFFQRRFRPIMRRVSAPRPPPSPPPWPYSECCKRLRHITVGKWDLFFSQLAHRALIIHINAMSTCMPAHTWMTAKRARRASRACVCVRGWGATIRTGWVLKGSDGRKYKRISIPANLKPDEQFKS